jgi:hypothetical protein
VTLLRMDRITDDLLLYALDMALSSRDVFSLPCVSRKFRQFAMLLQWKHLNAVVETSPRSTFPFRVFGRKGLLPDHDVPAALKEVENLMVIFDGWDESVGSKLDSSKLLNIKKLALRGRAKRMDERSGTLLEKWLQTVKRMELIYLDFDDKTFSPLVRRFKLLCPSFTSLRTFRLRVEVHSRDRDANKLLRTEIEDFLRTGIPHSVDSMDLTFSIYSPPPLTCIMEARYMPPEEMPLSTSSLIKLRRLNVLQIAIGNILNSLKLACVNVTAQSLLHDLGKSLKKGSVLLLSSVVVEKGLIGTWTKIISPEFGCQSVPEYFEARFNVDCHFLFENSVREKYDDEDFLCKRLHVNTGQ